MAEIIYFWILGILGILAFQGWHSEQRSLPYELLYKEQMRFGDWFLWLLHGHILMYIYI